MNEDDYVWDPAAESGEPTDPFVRSLEHRLAPLGDEVDGLVDAVLDELGLEADADADADRDTRADQAIVVPLHAAPSPVVARRPRERSWPWLAAALAVLGLSLFTLARDQRRRLDASALVEVGAAPNPARRVVLGVNTVHGTTAHAVLVSLRDVHDELAACSLALAPGRTRTGRVTVQINVGIVTDLRPSLGDAQLDRCVTKALADWDPNLGAAKIELELTFQDQRRDP